MLMRLLCSPIACFFLKNKKKLLSYFLWGNVFPGLWYQKQCIKLLHYPRDNPAEFTGTIEMFQNPLSLQVVLEVFTFYRLLSADGRWGISFHFTLSSSTTCIWVTKCNLLSVLIFSISIVILQTDSSCWISQPFTVYKELKEPRAEKLLQKSDCKRQCVCDYVVKSKWKCIPLITNELVLEGRANEAK